MFAIGYGLWEGLAPNYKGDCYFTLQHIVIGYNQGITRHWGCLASVIWLNIPPGFDQPTTFPSSHVSYWIPSIEAAKQLDHKHLTQKVQSTLSQGLDVVRTRLNAGGSILSGDTTKQGELTCGSYNIKLLQVLASIFFKNDLFPKTHLPKITPKNIS